MSEDILPETYKDYASFKIETAASILQLSSPALRNCLNQGLISFVRVSPRRIVIPRSEIERVLRHGIDCSK